MEEENGKLKKLLAEQMLDNAILRDINSKNGNAGRKVESVVQLIKVYPSRRADDAELRDAIKQVSRKRRRVGYPRIHVMDPRQGCVVNHNKFRRIYTEEKLRVWRKVESKRTLGTRKPIVLSDGLNQRWISYLMC